MTPLSLFAEDKEHDCNAVDPEFTTQTKKNLPIPLANPSPENQSPIIIGAQSGVILAIEDDCEDVELLRLALAKKNWPAILISVPFARDAIKYLARIGEFADKSRYPWPNLIVLDLSLPGMSGMEFLLWARGEANIPPIIVLTYSKLGEDRQLAQRLGAKGYFLKSADLTGTAAMIDTFAALCTLPKNPPEAPAAP